MINDRDLVRQMLKRDVINVYRSLPNITNRLGINITPFLGLFEDKILSYADVGVEAIVGWLFGTETSCDIDEAAEIAKMFTSDKIDEYRKKVHEMKSNTLSNEV